MTRTEITFTVDPAILATDSEGDPAHQPLPLLTEVFLLFPVRVVVADREVFASQTALLYMAVDALGQLQRFRQTLWFRQALFLWPPGGGFIVVNRLKGHVLVSGDLGGAGHVPYSELLEAWVQFSRHVAEFVTEHFPEMRQHRHLRPWFKEIGYS